MIRSPSNTFRFVLLGLLFERPRSGYDIRKLFMASPLKMFSPSPGSIYPALHRLRDQGLIECGEDVNPKGRRRELFRLTTRGLNDLRDWLMLPVVQDDIVRNIGELQMKFVLTEEALGLESAIVFLTNFERELQAYVEYLEEYFKIMRNAGSICGRLSLELGIESYRTHAEWARRAHSELSEKIK